MNEMIPFIGSLSDIYEDADLASRSSESVLIMGETGTGKEILARYIHQNSRRSSNPFIALNCAAIPSELLESELFGYSRGAFTGAVQDKAGLLESAEGGTVLLDEIGDLSGQAQAKILRAIETKEIVPLGSSSKPRSINARFIAATNADIRRKVESGEFRKDLYYRLSIFTYSLPAVRERNADIPAMAAYLLNEIRTFTFVSPKVLELFLCYPWPGNMREMKNVLIYASQKAEGKNEIDLEHLPRELQNHCKWPNVLQNIDLKEKTDCFERLLLSNMMAQLRDPRIAADQLGLNLRTFYRKLKKYDIHW